MKLAISLALSTALLACQPGTYYLIDAPQDGGVRDPEVRLDAGGGSMMPANRDASVTADATTTQSDATVPADSDASTPSRDAETPLPPPPDGDPYENATEAANDLTEVLDLTGRFGVALAGGHLLASNASGGSGFPRETAISSSGSVSIPAGATVRHALLFYAGIIFQKPHTNGEGDYTTDRGGALDGIADVRGNGITFSIDAQAHGPFDPSARLAPNPSTLGSEATISPRNYAPSFGTFTGLNESVWGNRLDITGLFQGKSGNVAITVNPPERLDLNGNNSTRNGGNPAGNTTYNLCSGAASWSLLVIYEDATLPEKNLVLMDGAWARAWDYLFFHDGTWHRPKIRVDHAPIRAGAKFYTYVASSSPVGTTLPSSPACSCGCGGAYTLKNTAGPYGRNNYFSDTLVDPPAAQNDPMHRDRSNGPWYLHATNQPQGIAGNDWTLFQSGEVYTEFPNLYEGEDTPVADNIQPVTNENDADASNDTYAGHPWNGRGTVTYHGSGNATSTIEVELDPARITPGERVSYLYLKGDQKDVWKPQQVISMKYLLLETPLR